MGNELNNPNNNSSNSNSNNYTNNEYKNYNPPAPVKKETKKCPFCGLAYLYNTPIQKNKYLLHEEDCRYRFNKNNQNKNINTNNNSNNTHNNNLGSLVLTNSENEFLKESKKELPRGKKDGTFEEKVDYLRYDISKKKVDFTEGCETLYISRENVLENSMIQLEILNLFKEIKIIFTGEESSDAGGLIREWLTILFKELLDPKTGLFERSDTDEVSYIISHNSSKNKENLDKYYFIGRILAKALLENLTVNCCFNKVIYQLILGEKIEFNDLIFIDKPLYNSLKNLMTMKEECSDNIALCEIYFSYQYHDERGDVCYQDLIENGNDILVTKENFDLYIEKRIEYFTKTQLVGVNEIIRGINTIFNVDLLKIFTSDQLGLLINGTPFIDVDDWRLNTQYKNYNDYDNVIINFWDIISNLSQEDLSNFLLFCTGSSRVPIGGFKSLESNRGQISKFEIVKTDYVPGAKNFLRVHTCFNRLDLPEYPDKLSLETAIKFALENQVLGYGIE
jgi:E3 ubiquitin-protein ligase HUWE1